MFSYWEITLFPSKDGCGGGGKMEKGRKHGTRPKLTYRASVLV
jgi:hypothetical protein